MGTTLSTFGDLRAAVNLPPSPSLWHTLCLAIERWPDAMERDERVIPYLAGALRHWPDEMLVTPERWVQRFLGNEPVPYLYIARHLLIQGLWLDRSRTARLTHAPQLSNIRVLTLHGSRQDPELLAALLTDSSWMQTLHTLELHHNALDVERAHLPRVLDNLARLEHLKLYHMSLDADALDTLLHSPLAEQLRTLGLNHNPLGEHALDPLHAIALPRLERLDLSGALLGERAVMALRDARNLGGLHTLALSHNAIGESGAAALCEAPWLATIHTLHLAYAHLNDGAIEQLAQNRKSTALSSLTLHGNKLTNHAARALARSPYLAGLRALRLDLNEIDVVGWHMLATSPHFDDSLKETFQSISTR